MTRRQGGERGQGLLTALLVLLLVSTAIGLLAGALHRQLRLVRQEAAGLELRALSDAALAEALAELTLDAHFAGAPEHAFASGSIASEVERVGTHRYRLLAHARRGLARRTVEAEVHRIDGVLRVVEWHREPGD